MTGFPSATAIERSLSGSKWGSSCDPKVQTVFTDFRRLCEEWWQCILDLGACGSR
ncbi:unnamed protein product [Periconia digitata]|uniref:Uncharacterized protein n=1 Tax=Periconia digitata TaxID=1303443 RepID=A0A9W4UED7_9PLEO|nr:unnamed protein product [Periconia digitata]